MSVTNAKMPTLKEKIESKETNVAQDAIEETLGKKPKKTPRKSKK